MTDETPWYLTIKDLSSGINSKDRGSIDVAPTVELETSSLCQWSMGGGGFFAANTTLKRLPAGVYVLQPTQHGIQWKPMKMTTDDLYRLPDSKSDEVIAEVEQFWTLGESFKKFGFAHKRGYLLHGNPGSGKTSTLAFITKTLISNGGIVILAEDPRILKIALQEFRQVEPDRPVIIVWEDIDTLIRNWGESDILSILDGEGSIERVVNIATTNYPENLDGRIVNRPSRFDRVIKIGLPNDQARRDYLMKKLGKTEHEQFDLVAETDGLSIAHIKELIVGVFCQQIPIADILERLKKMKQVPVSDSDKKKIGF